MLCALNHAFIIAALLLIAAVIVWCVGFGRAAAHPDMDVFLHVLRSAEVVMGGRSTMIEATVHPNLISAPVVAAEKTGTRFNRVISFRDELPPLRWREVSTRLRHQPRPAPQVKLPR